MGFIAKYPYTDFHELNLDYLLQVIKSVETTLTDFVSLNAIKYADPIQWSITRQYEKNTVVIDPLTGTAYISVAPVPIGAALTRTEYWTVVFDLEQFVTKASENFANTYEAQTTTTATQATPQYGWIVWGGFLYVANTAITPGDAYVVGGNITRITVEDICGHIETLNTTDKSNLVAAVNEVLASLISTAGDLNNLTTTDKSNLVAAINEVITTFDAAVLAIQTDMGDLATLTTTDKSSLVNAINEVLSDLASAVATIDSVTGDLANLNTTDKTSLVNAINEVLSDLASAVATIDGVTGDLADLTTTDKTSLVNAINELVSSLTGLSGIVGDLADLTTTDKTSIVNAINEVVSNLTGLSGIVGDLADLTTTDKTSIVNAINEVVSGLSGLSGIVGDLADLHTADKSSIVNAINEVMADHFETVADMIAANIAPGVAVMTMGYHSVNDEGGALYYIMDTAPASPAYYETLNNGNYAVMITNGELNVKAFGAYGDDSHDDTVAIKAAITAAGGTYDITFTDFDDTVKALTIKFPEGVYLISEELRINKNNINIIGCGNLNTVIKCSTVRVIESIITLTGSYGCTIRDIQLNGNIPFNSTVAHNPVNYGACCGLWLDQIAYCEFTNITIAQTRCQGMRWCHVWQNEFNDIRIYHTSNYGTAFANHDIYFGTAILHSLVCQIDETFNPSASVKTSESNQITVNRLEVTGLMGGTFTIFNDMYNSVVQNVVFNDVIEENSLFDQLTGYDLPPCFAEPAWDLQGRNYFVSPSVPQSMVTINGHYVYYHNYTFNLPKTLYYIASPCVKIKNAYAYCVKSDTLPYPGINKYVHSASESGIPDVELTLLEENYSSDATKDFDYLVDCQDIYGVQSPATGRVSYQRCGTAHSYVPSDMMNNMSLFTGMIIIEKTVYQSTGITPV